MPLELYNTLTRHKDLFVPIDPTNIRMYVCGPTVYARPHIGNARSMVVFDILYRLLNRFYKRVTYVRNITDLDDKINALSIEKCLPISAITEETIRFFHEDMDTLNILSPDIEPHATAHITIMIAMIKQLIEKEYAYVAAKHVLFNVASAPSYGALSKRSRTELLVNARVEAAPYKKDPADFVLWKPSPTGQPSWDSPWGHGRPGWHIECSAMSSFYLGETFDIHGGGCDLIFPHHENEIIQSTCAHGKQFVRYWIHNGWLTIAGAKMSKSLGNFITVRELLERGFSGETIRLALLSTHYRQPLNWTSRTLHSSQSSLDRFYSSLRTVSDIPIQKEKEVVAEDIIEALCDDLNTPRALAAMHETATALNKATHSSEKAYWKGRLLDGALILGLSLEHLTVQSEQNNQMDIAYIEKMVACRNTARRTQNFPKADQIRKALHHMGVILEDSKTGTTWRRAF